VTTAEGYEGFLIGGRPDGLTVHPVNEFEVVAAVAGPTDEKARGLVGAGAITVHPAWRYEEEVAAAGLAPLAAVQHVDVSF